jgi:hypothetical protein
MLTAIDIGLVSFNVIHSPLITGIHLT